MSSYFPKEQRPTGRQQEPNQVNTAFNGINALETALTNVRFKNYNEELNRDGYNQVELGAAGGTAVLADSTITPTADTDGREGWLFENTIAGTKYNLYYFNGTSETMLLKDIASIYARVSVDSLPDTSVMPFLQIYTKPTGSGDAGAFYHSRLNYEWDGYDTVGLGEEIVYWANQRPTHGFSNRQLELRNLITEGDGDGDEEVLYIVLATNTAATTGGVRHVVSRLGFNTYPDNQFPNADISRNMRLTTAETTPASGGATEAKQDDMITQLTDMNSKITVGSDNSITGDLQQVLNYGRYDTDGTLKALRTDDEGRLYTLNFNSSITSGSDATLSSAQQVLCYGRDAGGNLDALKTDNNGHLEVVLDPEMQTGIISSTTTTINAGTALTFPVVLDKNGAENMNCLVSATTSLINCQVYFLLSDDAITFYETPMSQFFADTNNGYITERGNPSRYIRVKIENNGVANIDITSVKITWVKGI